VGAYGKRKSPVIVRALSSEALERWRSRARTAFNDDTPLAEETRAPELHVVAAPVPDVMFTCAPDPTQRRSAPRQKALMSGRVVFDDMMITYSCKIRDLSETGARITLSMPVHMPETFELHFNDGRVRRCELRRRHGLELGVAFTD